ncbi:MAG: hypothetical protein P8J66_06805, partial [Verrucomicrobiota bacterium]|nr:hypothetical protein [Verrucomicrobiota bacterium]
MNNILKTMTFVVALAAISLSSSIDVSAQGRGERGERGGRGGGRGNFDFSEMRARIMDSIKDRFGFSDAEFKAIQPLIEDIQEKQREART